MRKLYGVIKALTVLCPCLLDLIGSGKSIEDRNVERQSYGGFL